jgi:hypothetical protein
MFIPEIIPSSDKFDIMFMGQFMASPVSTGTDDPSVDPFIDLTDML